LRRLANRATYLVEDNGQYWYALGQTISRTAADRAQSRFVEEHADEEIRRRLQATSQRGDFAAVHWAPRDASEVPDEMEARLVVLGPEHPHSGGSDITPAVDMAMSIMPVRAGGPRLFRNALVFAAPDAARLEELRSAARSYLAWKSIWDEKEELNLDELSRRQAATQRDNFDETVNHRIGETYVWALVPAQRKGAAEFTWEFIRVTGSDPLPVRVSKKLGDSELLVTALGGVRLRMELDGVPLWQGDHVGTHQLWSYFAQYLYLPRLRDHGVLIGAIDNGVASTSWEQDAFAYAAAFDQSSGHYAGLVGGDLATVLIDSESLVVKPEAARRQLDQEAVPPGAAPGPSEPGVPEAPAENAPSGTPAGAPAIRRFFAVARLDPQRASRDAATIADEVLKHLVGILDSDVEVQLQIQATFPDGVPDDIVRTVTENAQTLKFEQHGFEQS